MKIPGLTKKFRRRPTLPHSCPCSTIGAEGLNFRVRDGNGCLPFAIATENLNSATVNLNMGYKLLDGTYVYCFVAKPHDQLVPVS